MKFTLFVSRVRNTTNPFGAFWPFLCEISGMTRIMPLVRAELAHSYSRHGGNEARASESIAPAETENRRAHYGNRRMGDRRGGERRAGGRRASDHYNRHEAGAWSATLLNAHIIGQWIEQTPASAPEVSATYRDAGKPRKASGDLA